jgi:hypothetical protein
MGVRACARLHTTLLQARSQVTLYMIAGGPRTGKTTLAATLGAHRSTDELLAMPWSAVSDHVASEWIGKIPVIEGVATARALRKWLARNPTGKPCDTVYYLATPRVELSKGQLTMAKGVHTVWSEIVGELVARGVVIV